MDNERYADSAQARAMDKACQRVERSTAEFVMTPEMLGDQAIRKEAERVASAARIKAALGKMKVFFGYAE